MNFKKIGCSGIPFVYVGKEVIHNSIQYEVFMIVYTSKIANQRKYQNDCHLKTKSQNHKYFICLY